MIAGSSGWSFTATLQATDRSLHISLEVRITQEMFRSSMRSLDSSPETQCTRFSMSSSAHKRRDVSTTFTYKWFYHIYMQTFFFFNPHLPIISWWLVCSILDQKVRCSPGFVTGKSPALLVYWWFIRGKLKGELAPSLHLSYTWRATHCSLAPRELGYMTDPLPSSFISLLGTFSQKKKNTLVNQFKDVVYDLAVWSNLNKQFRKRV